MGDRSQSRRNDSYIDHHAVQQPVFWRWVLVGEREAGDSSSRLVISCFKETVSCPKCASCGSLVSLVWNSRAVAIPATNAGVTPGAVGPRVEPCAKDTQMKITLRYQTSAHMLTQYDKTCCTRQAGPISKTSSNGFGAGMNRNGRNGQKSFPTPSPF